MRTVACVGVALSALFAIAWVLSFTWSFNAPVGPTTTFGLGVEGGGITFIWRPDLRRRFPIRGWTIERVDDRYSSVWLPECHWSWGKVGGISNARVPLWIPSLLALGLATPVRGPKRRERSGCQSPMRSAGSVKHATGYAWLLPPAAVLLTLPAVAVEGAEVVYLLCSGFIFAAELVIAGRIARRSSEHLPTVLAILCTMVLWGPLLVWVVQSELGGAGSGGPRELLILVTQSLATGLIIGGAFALYTGDKRAIVWMACFTIVAGVPALAGDGSISGGAVVVWHATTALGLMAWAQDHRAHAAAAMQLCPHCSYDLAGLPESAPCPECGKA